MIRVPPKSTLDRSSAASDVYKRQPLDDINIEKFNRIIRKFSKESQFIIITHNKLTMADVDVLYGVYMEDQGVSSVTAVDFRKYDHEVELEEMAN